MKKLNVFAIAALSVCTLGLWGCKKDGTEPSIEALGVMDYDLVQVSNDINNGNFAVVVTADDDKALSSVTVNITPSGSTNVIATQSLRGLTSKRLNRVVLNVPFPLPNVAPSGLYDVTTIVTDGNDKVTTKTYKVNVLNYRVQTAPPCVFNLPPLPPGRNVWLRVTAPPNTNGEDLFVSGNFEGTFSGCSDWSGGKCQALKMTKVPGSNTCYYIALNLTSASLFKITRGDWNNRMQDSNAQDVDNLTWNGQSQQDYTIGNWSDRQVLPPSTLPAGAIVSGRNTVVVDVNSNNDTPKYYLVKKGASSLTGAIQLLRVSGTNRMAAAVPREPNAEYIVVRDVITASGVNAYNYDQSVKLDAVSNPSTFSVFGFKGGFTPLPNPTNVLLTGDAVGGWTGNGPTLTNSGGGKFTGNVNFSGGGEYLMLPSVGGWGDKWGLSSSATSTPLAGFLERTGGAANLKGPSTAGTYRVDVDFTQSAYGTYRLTRQ